MLERHNRVIYHFSKFIIGLISKLVTIYLLPIYINRSVIVFCYQSRKGLLHLKNIK